MTWKRHIVSKIYLPAFFVFFILATVGWAKGQDVSSTSTIIDRLDKKLWVSVPAEYSAKLLNFVLNDTIMRTRSATAYTEEFIINEMKKDWWISKQNQLLFIWSSIYGWISKNFLYDRLDDDNETRSDEYEKTLAQINKSYEVYKKWFKTYMEMWIAEADRRSAEADSIYNEAIRKSTEYRKKTMWLDSIRVKNNMLEFYNMYIDNPNTIREWEINFMKERTKEVFSECKKYWINYRTILLNEVWDRRKVEEILKFYGVE